MPRYHAPGRVNLIGEHTDYAGGLVLPVAIDRGVTVDCVPAERIRLTSETEPGRVDVAADGTGAADGFGRYVAAVAAELAALGRPPIGIAGAISADLPSGAGLASSAALEVAVALALCDTAGFEPDRVDIVRACCRAEQRAVGVPCGPMDQAASLLGAAGHAVFLDCGSLEHRLIPLPAHAVLIVADSGVRRELAGTGYAERRAEVERALAGATDDVSRRRLRHVQSENERVRQAVAALERGDVAALGPILAAGHASLRGDFEVSTPELDLLVELARGAGAWAARMTGGGFGGAIVALASENVAERAAVAVAAGYREATGRIAEPMVARAADGARRLV